MKDEMKEWFENDKKMFNERLNSLEFGFHLFASVIVFIVCFFLIYFIVRAFMG